MSRSAGKFLLGRQDKVKLVPFDANGQEVGAKHSEAHLPPSTTSGQTRFASSCPRGEYVTRNNFKAAGGRPTRRLFRGPLASGTDGK